MRIAAGAGLCPLALGGCSGEADGAAGEAGVREALAYEKLNGGDVVCMLCPHQCTVSDGQRGLCGVRENQGGTYNTLVYGRVCAAHVDPIEKKPLFHFLPGTKAFSVATPGCNVECQFCQNWQISQARPEDIRTEYMSPTDTVAQAQRYKCPTIAFTYTEPTVFYEYVLDTARAGKEAGVHCVNISNGFIQAEPMKRLCEVLAAVKIDLKAFTEDFYRRYVRGRLRPVLDTLELLKKQEKHFEIVTLLIPGLNDAEDEVRGLSKWVVKNLGPDVPLHFTRFHPAYKMTNLAPTPPATIVRAREIAASEGVHYAYVGNLPGHDYENTRCHACGKLLVKRYSFYVEEVHVKAGKCEYCAQPIPGVWE